MRVLGVFGSLTRNQVEFLEQNLQRKPGERKWGGKWGKFKIREEIFFFFPIWVLKVNNGMRGRTTRVKFTELTISTSLR
jgi:hypothetical protein